jgi:hypothetical protein
MAGHSDNDGVALLWIILFIVFVLIVASGLYLLTKHTIPTKTVSVPGGMCTCADIPDLKNRLNEVNAAIEEYKAAIQDVNAHDATTGKPTMFNMGTYSDEKANLQTIVQSVHTPGTHSGTGETKSDCETTVTADTACIRGSLQTHENVHVPTCEKIKQKLVNAGTYNALTTDYKTSMTMVEYFNDEIAGYQAEIPYINTNLEKAKTDASCKWACDVDHKTYDSASECEGSCRPTLGSVIKPFGHRCEQTAAT